MRSRILAAWMMYGVCRSPVSFVGRVIPLYGGERDILLFSIPRLAIGLMDFISPSDRRQISRPGSSRIIPRDDRSLGLLRRSLPIHRGGASYRFTMRVIFVYGDDHDIFILRVHPSSDHSNSYYAELSYRTRPEWDFKPAIWNRAAAKMLNSAAYWLLNAREDISEESSLAYQISYGFAKYEVFAYSRSSDICIS